MSLSHEDVARDFACDIFVRIDGLAVLSHAAWPPSHRGGPPFPGDARFSETIATRAVPAALFAQLMAHIDESGVLGLTDQIE